MFKKLILSWGLLLCTALAFSQDFPAKSNTLVTDYAGILSVNDKQRLENKLIAFDDSTTTQIAVVIIKSVGSYDINQYAALLGRKWGIGSKEKNNGIVVLVAINDRKVAIQTGYGAEGAVPDGVTHDIIEYDIKPRFKASDYAGGLDAATNQLIKYMKGEYQATGKKARQKGGNNGGSAAGFIIIIVVFILIIIFRKRGGGGGGGQIIGSRGGASPFWWFLAGSALGRSSRSDWGGFSGGGGSGGSSGGGGFGGFGGGSFGGGGSSGSW